MMPRLFRSQNAGLLTLLVLGVVLAYAGLAVVASSCLPDIAVSPADHHHPKHDGMAHASLCAWACQANASPTVTTASPAATILLFSLSGFASRLSPIAALSPSESGARSPPPSFVS